MSATSRDFHGDTTVDPVSDRASWVILSGRDRRTGLWIVPDLWKTPRARFPQVLGRRQDRAAHNAPQALMPVCANDQEPVR
jgi:hypothetical protein